MGFFDTIQFKSHLQPVVCRIVGEAKEKGALAKTFCSNKFFWFIKLEFHFPVQWGHND